MIQKYFEKSPIIHKSSFIAENAMVIGDVKLEENSSVFFGSVIRGDINYVIIGKNSNIQDLSVLHVMDDAPCVVGDNVVVGHNVNLHACSIGNGSLIGIGSIVLSYVKIGSGSIIAAGSVIPEGKEIPDGVLVMGTPGKIIRDVTEEEKQKIIENANHYNSLRKNYLSLLKTED
jgi:carbonic anhydrase/acetyltransferase-like protein (isoleucine patch superfamily)